MQKPTDITELRDQMLDMFEQAMKDPKRGNQADAIANLGGKILGTVKAQLEYAAARGEQPEIPFLGKTNGKQLKPPTKLLSS